MLCVGEGEVREVWFWVGALLHDCEVSWGLWVCGLLGTLGNGYTLFPPALVSICVCMCVVCVVCVECGACE